MGRILVVDDEELVRETLCHMLEDAGYEVFEATNGNEALQAFEEQKIDVVVTDIFMPEKEGLETIAELRQRKPDVKIIAVSGGGGDGKLDYLDFAKRFGAISVLTKPFLREQVLSAVKAILD
ncbi:MAG: response regulator [Alphaproteobacteria bacterium]|nr:response regulator [Alphaproteobacteria bacterium]